MFRVRALNAAGLSQFSPESEPVEVKAAIGELTATLKQEAQISTSRTLITLFKLDL